jgi:hypothetical protein
MGSYYFSAAADTSNGENLLLIRDRRVAIPYKAEPDRQSRKPRARFDGWCDTIHHAGPPFSFTG